MTNSLEIPVSQATKDKAESIKGYIKSKYDRMTQEERQKREGSALLTVAWEKLKDKMQKAQLTPTEQELIKREILHREALINREG